MISSFLNFMNPWIAFLKEFRRQHPQLSLKECMKQASKAYKKK